MCYDGKVEKIVKDVEKMKKGFTLIELLAVIIILAVIALIATPIVLNVVNSAKLKAFEESAYGIIETVKLKNYEYMFEGTNTNKTYTFPTDELVFQGEKPEGGTVVLQNGNTALAIHNGKWCATKKLSDEKITITEDIENCDLKLVSLSGNITGVDTFRGNETYDQIIPIEGKVQLINNNKIIYETNSDSEGNYSFEDVVADEYIILVSKQYYTKYGMEITLNENTTKDIEANLYYSDIDNDNMILDFEKDRLDICFGYYTNSRIDCKKYDYNNDGRIDGMDLSVYNSYYGKISEIIIDKGTFTISGKITSDRPVTFSKIQTVKLRNNNDTIKAAINEDGTYVFENVPSGSYTIVSPLKERYGVYEKFIIVDKDMNIDIHLYYGAFEQVDDLSTLFYQILPEHLTTLESVIEDYNSLDEEDKADYWEGEYEYYDMNQDNVLDEKDIEMFKSNLEKYNKQLENNLCF